MVIEVDRLLQLTLDLVRIDSPSGEEDQIATRVMNELAALGLRPERDAAGNVVAAFPGVGEPVLLNAHLDSVNPCSGIRPVVRDGMVVSAGDTVLAADDKAGVAVILEVLRALGPDEPARPALEVVFTVQEELGLVGAKALDFSKLAARRGLVLDGGGSAGVFWVSAPGQDNISVTIRGRAAHAGVCPEEGISAIVAASRAIATMKLGRIDFETTANVGTIAGGTARNVVPEETRVVAEARSRDASKLEAQTRHMVAAFEQAAADVGAHAEVMVTRSYDAFRIREDDPFLQRLMATARSVGLEPVLKDGGGGSDANVFNQHGIDAVVLGLGIEAPHTTSEQLVIDDMEKAARLVLAFLTSR